MNPWDDKLHFATHQPSNKKYFPPTEIADELDKPRKARKTLFSVQ